MIKQILSKLFTQKITDEDIECAIDDNTVDCGKFDDDQDKAYVGVPAPILNPVDDWFTSSYGCPGPVITKKQEDYMEQETLIKQQQYQETNSVEPENIHQVMYEMATKGGATTVQLDPIGGSENFQGGSENIHQ